MALIWITNIEQINEKGHLMNRELVDEYEKNGDMCSNSW